MYVSHIEQRLDEMKDMFTRLNKR